MLPSEAKGPALGGPLVGVVSRAERGGTEKRMRGSYGPLRLSVPPEPSELKRVRHVVRAYAGVLGADAEAVVVVANEVLTYALVATAAHAFIDGQPAPDSIGLELRPRREALDLCVRASTPPPAEWETDDDLMIRVRLMSALADRTEIRTSDEGDVAIHATFPRSGA